MNAGVEPSPAGGDHMQLLNVLQREAGTPWDGTRFDVWIAFASPRMTRRGLWRDHAPLSTSQIAATLAAWMGIDWNAGHPQAGAPIR